MVDVLTKEQRKKNMRAIRSISRLENEVKRQLWRKGIRYRKNVKGLFGKPDIAIKKYKIVIFIDSCFWHGCEQHGRIPDTNREFWEKKIERNKERDILVTNYYKEKGWNILRVWEHDLKSDFDTAIENILSFIEKSKKHF